MIIEVSESSNLTLEQIKWLESVCRKQRKRLKSNSSKCDKTIDMFINYNLGANNYDYFKTPCRNK